MASNFNLNKIARIILILGNLTFLLWIIWNGIDEGAQGVTIIQLASYLSLMTLLILNIIFLILGNKNS